MKIFDVSKDTVRMCHELSVLLTKSVKRKLMQYRPLCGICRRAPCAQDVQNLLVASEGNSIQICSCKRGSYRVEVVSADPGCTSILHTYQLHTKPANKHS